jgi:hypothetical protein
MRPSGVMRPTWLISVSENHTLPSGPRIMPSGPAPGVGIGNSVISPRGVMRPILLAAFSANQRLPSAPTVIPIGVAFFVVRSNSVNYLVSGSKRPIFEAPLSQNHRQRSGPSTQM